MYFLHNAVLGMKCVPKLVPGTHSSFILKHSCPLEAKRNEFVSLLFLISNSRIPFRPLRKIPFGPYDIDSSNMFDHVNLV